MSDDRPDPDALLVRVQAEEAQQARGKLKIFFGAAPGVGKTYTMLEAARVQAKEGVDVVVGYIEPHVRPETQSLVLGLDVLARKQVDYRGAKLLEFDLDAALARRPQLIVVDELAHTNAPDQTHAKRWQDVKALLEAGISVFTTLNVQHLESLNDVVAQITGIQVTETVPDAVFDQADDVELVDLPPDDLLERLREGKVYVPLQAERAVRHFFSKGNLIALRELALRKAAERVGQQRDVYRQSHGVASVWPTSEKLLVCVGPSPFSARLVRATRRLAAGMKAPWLAVHVETPFDERMSRPDRERLSQTLRLAEELGGETATISGDKLVDELIVYARSRNVTKIIVGKPTRPRWQEWLHGSLVYQLTRKCGDIDIYVITGEQETKAASKVAESRPHAPSGNYLKATLVVAVCTVISWLLSYSAAPTNLIMVYLLGVVAVAAQFGRGPSILASILSVAAFDFCFIEPYLTFAVHDSQYLFTFVVMLATALTISTLTSRVKFQAESARVRERKTASLYAISHQLAGAQTLDHIARVAVAQFSEAVDAQGVLLVREQDEQMVPYGADAGGFVPSSHDQAVAQWVLAHGEMAGRGTGTLPGSAGLYLPLRASRGVLGVLGVLPRDDWGVLDPERLHLLEAYAGLIALAAERVLLATETSHVRVQMEAEKLRNSLLSAVSHDFRTPLSVIQGATSTLLDGAAPLDAAATHELLESILQQSNRLNRLVANLLDMTRLEAGAIELNRQLQSIDEVIGAALTHGASLLGKHPLTLSLPDDLPFVAIDELLIEQVLLNLLENAAKYSPEGAPIEIRAAATPQWLNVEVADRGPGLPADELDRVFEKFHRAGRKDGRLGTGLGLAICRGIVELHGGRIEAENRPDGGALVRFRLPLATEQPRLPAAEIAVRA